MGARRGNVLVFLIVVCVLLPVWLVWLGCQLSANDGKEYAMYAVGGPGATEMGVTGAARGHVA